MSDVSFGDVSFGDVFQDSGGGVSAYVQIQGPGVFEKPLSDYTTEEGLLLILVVLFLVNFLGDLWRDTKWHR